MDLPKCKICGERHRLGACSPTSSDDGVENRATSDNVKRQERVAGLETQSATIQRQVSPAGSSETKFDRVAYQREYMRGWRERQKAQRKIKI